MPCEQPCDESGRKFRRRFDPLLSFLLRGNPAKPPDRKAEHADALMVYCTAKRCRCAKPGNARKHQLNNCFRRLVWFRRARSSPVPQDIQADAQRRYVACPARISTKLALIVQVATIPSCCLRYGLICAASARMDAFRIQGRSRWESNG